MSIPPRTCIPGDFYCKCEGCRYLVSLAWAIPQGIKLLDILNLPPPIPEEASCRFCSTPCGHDHCPYTKGEK